MRKGATHDIYSGRSNENAKKSFLNSCEKGGVSSKNRELIQQFIEESTQDRGWKATTIAKYYYDLGTVLPLLQSDLNATSEAELRAWMRAIKDGDWTESTKEDYSKKVKTFYKWFKSKHLRRNGHEYPDEFKYAVEWLIDEYSYKIDKNKESAPVFLTEDEAQRIVSATPEVMQKALFAVLWISGCRIGEILTLQLRDVEKHPHGFLLHLRSSKTVLRPVPILDEPRIGASRYLRMLLTLRKRRGAAETDVLFTNQSDDPLSYAVADTRLKQAVADAGINKQVAFTAFRKGRATYLANKGWTEATMDKMFGWKPGSKTSSYYVQQAGIDVTQRMAQELGLADEEEHAERFLTCTGCSMEMPLGSEFCGFCGRPLSASIAEKQESEEQDLLEELLKEKHRDLIEQYVEKRLAELREESSS